MTSVTTSIDSTTGGVLISWAKPSTGGLSIDSYNIEILDSTGTTWTNDTSDCDGSSLTIITNLYCIIPMTSLTSSPYSLAFEDLVYVRISAHNSLGYGATSTVNTAGAQIRSVPTAMGTPTATAKSDIGMTISWTALTGSDTGDSTITSYDLVWDNGNGTVTT